jgi:hypothetical protein
MRYGCNRPGTRRGWEEAVRIAVLVADPDLAEAVAAALGALGSVHVSADGPAALEATDWDVCVAEAGFAGAVVEARPARGLVVLTETPEPRSVAWPGRRAGAVVLLRLPFTLADLRRSVRTAAAAAWAGDGPATAP